MSENTIKIDAKLVAQLREQSGAGMMDCKKALAAEHGDAAKALEYLRKKGLQAAAKKADRVAAEGAVHSYIHGGGSIGVLVEINCETDFVARTEGFRSLCHDIALHIAAAAPEYVQPEEVPAEVLAKEREILAAQVAGEGKPAAIVEKIVEGRIAKFYAERCLMAQPYVKAPEQSVAQMVAAAAAKMGEKVVVRRFARFVLGAGLEKKHEDFASEVQKVMQA